MVKPRFAIVAALALVPSVRTWAFGTSSVPIAIISARISPSATVLGRTAPIAHNVPFFAAEEEAKDDSLTSSQSSSSSSSANDFDIAPTDGSPSAINAAASFMVSSFWLGSPQNLLFSSNSEDGKGEDVSEAVRSALIRRQADDLTEKYGERMGRRTLDAALIVATKKKAGEESEEIMGLVAIEARLFDLESKRILTADKSEAVLKNAVASLGPKQRRQYKDSAVSEVVAELTPPEIGLVCVLSNLCTSPKARRRGLGAQLCEEAESIAREGWYFDEMYLRVEAENEAARGLYEGKLGYEVKFTDDSASGLRVDENEGDFIEVPAPTLVLAKTL